jgi:hypothetical protein
MVRSIFLRIWRLDRDGGGGGCISGLALAGIVVLDGFGSEAMAVTGVGRTVGVCY